MNNNHGLAGFSSASCVVSSHPETGNISALRWNYKKADWECFAEGTSRESANVIQSAYNGLPARGGQLLIKSGEYLISKTLFFNRSHTDICFEAGAELKPTDDFLDFMMIGADEETIDQANNIMFTNFRLIFPVGPIVINNPEGQIRPVCNLYFYGIQIHWLYDNNCKKYHPELVSLSHKQCNLIQILSGHDIHFLGENFQFMDNRGTFITLGGTQKVHSITIKGKIWGGGSGSTHLLVKNADHLFLPCTISNKSGIAVDWGVNKPQVHQYPVILEGEIHGTYIKGKCNENYR